MRKFLLLALLFGSPAVVLAGQSPSFTSGSRAGAANLTSISTARELYAAARYDEALVILDGLRPSSDAALGERKLIEQYRSLCLLALGRGDEAEVAIAAVVRADPFYQPSEAEASPRVRSTFADVRKRLLPDLASSRYAEARQAYDRKQFAEAATGFRELVLLLDDPLMNGRLADLRTLASGFVELAAAAAAPPPAPKEELAPEPPAPAAPVAPAAPSIYTAEEPGIVPPVTIRQEVPAVPASIARMIRSQGMVDLTIDEQGRLVSIVLRASLHPVYDRMLVEAARHWKYKPAMLNGVAVPFRKLLSVSLSSRE
jgi:TonB family protein